MLPWNTSNLAASISIRARAYWNLTREVQVPCLGHTDPQWSIVSRLKTLKMSQTRNDESCRQAAACPGSPRCFGQIASFDTRIKMDQRFINCSIDLLQNVATCQALWPCSAWHSQRHLVPNQPSGHQSQCDLRSAAQWQSYSPGPPARVAPGRNYRTAPSQMCLSRMIQTPGIQ